MNSEKKSLGRGLDALLGERKAPKPQGITEIPLDSLTPGQYQPRKRMHKNTLEELAQSIKEQGVLQPIIVKKQASGSFEIVLGERRWRAAKLAGLATLPAIIKDLDNSETAKISLVENLQREDLNAMDLSRGLQRLQKEFNLSQEELAIAIGKSRSSVANLIRLTKLAFEAQELLEKGKIEMGHARTLLALKNEEQGELAKEIYEKGLSVREAEKLASAKKDKKTRSQKPRPKDPNTSRIEREISESLGAEVDISHNKRGKGRLTLKFDNLDQLQGILEKLKNKMPI